MKKIEQTWSSIRRRDAVEDLPAHLGRRYGIQVTNMAQLDAGVYRVDARSGSRWVARLFPSARPYVRAEGDADILRFLEEHNFPAERLAHAEPVSTHEQQALLVTRFIDGAQLSNPDERTFEALGEMLGRLHGLPEGSGGVARKGGAIHAFTLNEGGLRNEIADAMSWLGEADVPAKHKELYDSTLDQMSQIDYGEDLPHALIHPDPVPRNVIATPHSGLAPIDWTGAGRGPRAHSLAFLLLSAVIESRWNPNSNRVDAVIHGYRKHIRLEAEECAAIATAMPLHILVRDCAEFCLGRMAFDEVAGGYTVISRLAATVADKVRRAH